MPISLNTKILYELLIINNEILNEIIKFNKLLSIV
jgi:hypothetical protein